MLVWILLATITTAFLGTLLTEKFALKYGILPKNSYRRKPSERVALLGGVPLVLASGPGLMWLEPGWASEMLIAFTPMFVIGILDDVYEVRGRYKVAAQITTAALWTLMMPAEGNFFVQLLGSTPLGLVLTTIWVVSLINAVNFVDGMDGQATVIAALCGGALAFVIPHPEGIWILLAALSGFLVRNFNPAKIYLGEVGSSYLGFMLASLSTLIPVTDPHWTHFVALLFIFSVPLSDTLAAIVRRIHNRVSIFTADREHIHHRLIKLQFSPRQALLVTGILVFTSGATAALCFKSDVHMRLALFAQAGGILTMTFCGLFWLEKRMSQRLLGLSSRMIIRYLVQPTLPHLVTDENRGVVLDLLPYFRELQGQGVLEVHDFMQELSYWIQSVDERTEVRALGSYSLLIVCFGRKNWSPEEITAHSGRLYDLLHKFRVVRNTKPIPEGLTFCEGKRLDSVMSLSQPLSMETGLKQAS
jgi:UDP-GlcNAc:undecaprenyl-phosphate/decaprenyl-phosphate GlcNAc-1-phosphate transferase